MGDEAPSQQCQISTASGSQWDIVGVASKDAFGPWLGSQRRVQPGRRPGWARLGSRGVTPGCFVAARSPCDRLDGGTLCPSCWQRRGGTLHATSGGFPAAGSTSNLLDVDQLVESSANIWLWDALGQSSSTSNGGY